MGWVYEARHRALDRRVAIKVLKDAHRADDRRIQRFEREAQAASRLHHPHVVSITDFGRTDSGLMYLVTEFVEGPTLSAWLAQSPQPELGRRLGLFHQVLSAIEEAHAARVIHRDLKPDNVMVLPLRSGHEYAKVLDFGIALLADRSAKQVKLTRSGMVVGTPGYISPEQASGSEGDERADIYALGCMLHELLTGRVPFEHVSAMAVMVRRLKDTPPPPSEIAPERTIPPELDQVVLRALSREPGGRYASVGEFRQALLAAVRAVVPLELGCERCNRSLDPASGLCDLHPPPVSEPAALRPSSGARDGPAEQERQDAAQERQDAERPVGLAETLEARVKPAATPQRRAGQEGGAGSSGRLRPPIGIRGEQLPAPAASFGTPSGEHAAAPPAAPRPSSAPRSAATPGTADSELAAGSSLQAASTAAVRAPRPSFASRQLTIRSLSGPDLVGRTRVIGRLADFLLGPATVLELTGAPGLGKRSLLKRLGRAAQARALTVVALRPDPRWVGRPWYPVRCLLGQVLGHGPEPADVATLLEAAAELGLPPEDEPGLALLFGRRHPHLPGGRVARWRLTHRAVQRSLRTLGAVHGDGLCVLVDSPRRYDRATLDFVRLFARQARPGLDKVVIAAPAPLLPPAPGRELLQLEPLGPDDALSLLERRAVGQPEPERVEALIGAAEGSPLHLLQGLQALEETGRSQGSLAAVVASRLDALDSDSRGLLVAISALGRNVPPELLGDLLPAHTLYLALGLLVRRGWLVDEQDGTVSPVHPSVAELTLEAIPTARRRALHGHLLRILEGSGASVFERAHHADAAGQAARAMELYELAGDEAWRRMDGEGAALLYYPKAQDLAAWRLHLPRDDATYLRLAFKQGSALLATGHRMAAEPVLAEVLAAEATDPELARKARAALES